MTLLPNAGPQSTIIPAEERVHCHGQRAYRKGAQKPNAAVGIMVLYHGATDLFGTLDDLVINVCDPVQRQPLTL